MSDIKAFVIGAGFGLVFSAGYYILDIIYWISEVTR